MKMYLKGISGLVLAILGGGTFCNSLYADQAKSERKFKVTIIYAEGGGGHKAAMAAYEEALRNYAGRPEGVTLEFRKVDPLSATLSGGVVTQFWDTCFRESYYDLLSPGFWTKDMAENHVLPALASIGKMTQSVTKSVNLVRKSTEAVLDPLDTLVFDAFAAIMKDGRPDMIISVINSGNKQFLSVAREHGIPFRIGTTDYMTEGFIQGIGYSGEHYTRDQFEVYVPSEAEAVTLELKKRDIAYAVTGYPVSPTLNKMAYNLRNRDPQTVASILELLSHYGVAQDDSVMFVMMGAKGFDMNATMKYIEVIKKNASQLHKQGKKLQLFLAAGQNEALRTFGRNLALSNDEDFVIHALDNLKVEEVASFMGIYQVGNPYLMFTKPGGSTVGQAEAMGTPTLYSLNPIEHERFNANLMKSYNYADTIDMSYRSQALHAQKMMELSSKVIEKQVETTAQMANQVANFVSPYVPFYGFFNGVAQGVGQAVNQAVGTTVGTVGQIAQQRVPNFILNQDVVDEAALVNTLRKYLVEDVRLAAPPANRFAEIVAPLIYDDLMRMASP